MYKLETMDQEDGTPGTPAGGASYIDKLRSHQIDQWGQVISVIFQ